MANKTSASKPPRDRFWLSLRPSLGRRVRRMAARERRTLQEFTMMSLEERIARMEKEKSPT